MDEIRIGINGFGRIGRSVLKQMLDADGFRIVDAESTMVLRNRVAKVLSWYDNEWGYSARLVDMARLIARPGN